MSSKAKTTDSHQPSALLKFIDPSTTSNPCLFLFLVVFYWLRFNIPLVAIYHITFHCRCQEMKKLFFQMDGPV